MRHLGSLALSTVCILLFGERAYILGCYCS